jgi:hypothetical protein
VTGEPLAAESSGAFAPLRLSQARHLEPGHGYGERPDPLTARAAPRPAWRTTSPEPAAPAGQPWPRG